MTLTSNDLSAIGNLIDQKMDKVSKKLIKQMKQETKQIVNFFDEEFLGHDKRIKRIENHLHLSPDTTTS